MRLVELVRWQWDGYHLYHRSRKNLLIHIVAVPLFLVGNVGVVLSFVQWTSIGLFSSLALMALSLALQGRGHAIESLPSIPFSGKLNMITRLLLEQWINFPRFVLTGGWLRAFKQSQLG